MPREQAKYLSEMQMTSAELDQARNEHYQLDDEMRVYASKMTPAQKKQAIQAMKQIVGN